ncbi:MAG: RHS repeat-associated core domain-containing protein, partial [bacterium]
YSYNNNGNLIKKDNTTYAYDYENRLTQITYPDNSTQTFTYCPLGKRISKTPSSINYELSTMNYLYDDQDLIAEYSPEGTLTSRYTFGPGIDNPISVRIGSESYFYHLDGLGSVIFITDKEKNIVSSYNYDAFGMPFGSSSIPNPFLFTSREYEPKANLYYYRARYYDPEVGRFLSMDPILGLLQSGLCPSCSKVSFSFNPILPYLLKLPEMLHPYVYVENNPVNLVDPKGLIGIKSGCDCLMDCLGDSAKENLKELGRCLVTNVPAGAAFGVGVCGVITLFEPYLLPAFPECAALAGISTGGLMGLACLANFNISNLAALIGCGIVCATQ